MTKSIKNGTIITSSVEFIISGGKIIGETDFWNAPSALYFYDASGTPVSMYFNSTRCYYATNLQGGVIALYAEGGAKICDYYYNAYGACTISYSSATTAQRAAAAFNPLRYRGYYYDTETGLHYLGSRYYDPETGRFLNADNEQVILVDETALTDKNYYAYCDNNPVLRKDANGTFWHILVGGIIGAAINTVAKAVSNAIEGKPITEGLRLAALSGAASGALAATGAKVVVMAVGSAAISAVENTVSQVVENKGFDNFDVGDLAIDTVIGGVSGLASGGGSGSKHLNTLGKQTIKRTFREGTRNGFRAGLHEARKAASYYIKSTKSYYKSVFKKMPKDIAEAIATFYATDYMKEAWR